MRRKLVLTRLLGGTSVLVVALALAGCGGDSEPVLGTATAVTASATATVKQGERVVKNGDTVSVHYRGTLDDGTEFDSSRGREPLSFTVGSGQVIAGFDEAVMGLKVGDKNKVRLEPAKAYGERREEMVVTIPAAQAPAGLKAGDRVQIGGAPAVVTKVDAGGVTVDANHALAGKALTFEVELVSIK
ncbi:MAG: peptidylprolyl isomerase [Chloroflexi bacterium]|nr:peptidylprolyl isomerase [Chloroflexota bacterium]